MSRASLAQQDKTLTVLSPMQGVLQRKCACGNKIVASRECMECAKKNSILQRKLTIGASHDPLEQEADRVVDQVMAMPTRSTFSYSPPRIQRYTGRATERLGTAPASVDRVLASSGRPLEPVLRQDMEQRFGHDFSQVRVHSGAAAEKSAWDVSSHAYTVGHDIVFGAGRFVPGSHKGRRLLAHELAHVVQQSGNEGSRPVENDLSPVASPLVMSNIIQVSPLYNSRDVLQRDPKPKRSTRSRRKRSDADLRYMGRRPSFALSDWRHLNQMERDKVLWDIIRKYGADFALQFREYACRRQKPNLLIEYTNLPSVTPKLLTTRGYRYAGDLNGLPTWVHPSGREVVIVPRSKPRRAESVPLPSEQSPDVQEEEEMPTPFEQRCINPCLLDTEDKAGCRQCCTKIPETDTRCRRACKISCYMKIL